ncbi:hypothetical protein Tco_0360660 [Tanacetum coccineum]
MLAPKCPTFNGRPTFANPSKSRQAYNVMTNNINHLKEIVDQAWVKHSNDLLHLRNPTAQDMEILVKTCLMPLALKTQNDSFAFVHELKQEMHADLKILKPSVLGKLTPFSDSLERKYFAKKKPVSKTNESEGLSKPVTPQNLPQTATQAVRNTNVITPSMYRIASRVAHKTNVSRPQPRSNQIKDKVVPNTSHVKFKKTEVQEHPRISSISNQTKSVTACNDSLNSRTLNVNAICTICGKCVFNSNHDACVSKFLNDVNARTKKPTVVPINTRKPKSQANKSVATPHKKQTSKAWKWCIAQQCPSAYTWVPKTKRKWVPKVMNENVTKTVSFAIDNIVQLIIFIVDSGCTKHMTGNLSLLCKFVKKKLGTVRFGNDQFAPILGYEDFVQRNITINRVYYVEGLNYNLFSVGQFCDVELEVAFQKSTRVVRDLQGNDLLTDNHGTDLYTISLQETTSSTLICLMLKASPLKCGYGIKDLSHLNIVLHQKGRLMLASMDTMWSNAVLHSINGGWKKYNFWYIVDDYSRYTWTLFLRSKDETPEVLKDFLMMI